MPLLICKVKKSLLCSPFCNRTDVAPLYNTHYLLIIAYIFLIFKETIRKPLVFFLYGRILYKFLALQETNERIIVLYHIINLLFLNIFYFFLRQTAGMSCQTLMQASSFPTSSPCFLFILTILSCSLWSPRHFADQQVKMIR